MKVITGLETQVHDAERLSVFLDGSFAFGVSALVAQSHGLRLGGELSDAEVESLLEHDVVDKAYGAALNFLSFRPRSRREVQDYFRRRQTDPAVGESVLERLERAGLVDDDAFARFWVENRQTFRPRGARALRDEMRQKGLAIDVIEEALQQIGDEDVIALEAGRKKARTLPRTDEREFFRRLVGFLQRRGFSYEVAARVARRLYADEED